MKRHAITVFFLFFLVGGWAQAQETPKYTFNVGGGPTWPTQSVSDFANMSGNFVIGAGANLSSTLGFSGEFMWNDLSPKSSIVALTNAADGSARLYSVTGNLLLHTPEERKIGGYVIGGTGWYHRSWELTNPVITLGTVCLPSYLWWGVVCQNGLVQSNVAVASGSSNAIGWNIGGGFTYRLGESHAKFYTEFRYHVAYTEGINTNVLPLTFGIRF